MKSSPQKMRRAPRDPVIFELVVSGLKNRMACYIPLKNRLDAERLAKVVPLYLESIVEHFTRTRK